MTSTAKVVRDHYQEAIGDRDALMAHLSQTVDDMGGSADAAQLARLDQFHFGGLAATAELARRAGVRPDMKVLDAGSGLGGPARYLAETFGCHVTGVDLAPDYVAIASLFTTKAGLSGQVRFQAGDLTALPFDDASFDLVWTQHVAMNIRDRPRLYGELRRVLKPGHTFAFYDPIAGDRGQPPLYPVPWAASADTSTLLTKNETIAVLEAAGFRMAAVEDVTEDALGWMSQQGAPVAGAVNATMIVGARMTDMAANFGRSLKEGRVRLLMGLCTAVAESGAV